MIYPRIIYNHSSNYLIICCDNREDNSRNMWSCYKCWPVLDDFVDVWLSQNLFFFFYVLPESSVWAHSSVPMDWPHWNEWEVVFLFCCWSEHCLSPPDNAWFQHVSKASRRGSVLCSDQIKLAGTLEIQPPVQTSDHKNKKETIQQCVLLTHRRST